MILLEENSETLISKQDTLVIAGTYMGFFGKAS